METLDLGRRLRSSPGIYETKNLVQNVARYHLPRANAARFQTKTNGIRDDARRQKVMRDTLLVGIHVFVD